MLGRPPSIVERAQAFRVAKPDLSTFSAFAS
jgi:hypothetical protein